MDVTVTDRLVNSARSTVELGLRASRFGALTVRHEPMLSRLYIRPPSTGVSDGGYSTTRFVASLKIPKEVYRKALHVISKPAVQGERNES